MNTANKLTMLRVAMIPVFLTVLYIGFSYNYIAAIIIFIVAGITDIVDGYIARSRGQVTDFGKLMDPLADKMLVLSAILWFVGQGSFPVWAALVVHMREFMITAMRMIGRGKGQVIAAGLLGKIKTVVAMVVLPFMFLPLEPCIKQWVDYTCVGAIVLTTVISGVAYVIKNRGIMDWKT